MIGRDVPLPPSRDDRWTPIRGSQTRVDSDPIGPDEARCAALASRLAQAHVAMAFLFQAGLLGVLGSTCSATDAPRNAVRGIGGLDPVVPVGPWWTPTLILGLTAMGAAVAGVVAGILVRGWLVARARDGGWHGWRVGRAVDPEGALDPEARWRAIVAHEQANGGIRPESVVRWTRALRAPPDPALRPWVVGLREQLRDGEALAQQATTSGRAGGTSPVSFGGMQYEAAELCTLCRTALEHVRQVLART